MSWKPGEKNVSRRRKQPAELKSAVNEVRWGKKTSPWTWHHGINGDINHNSLSWAMGAEARWSGLESEFRGEEGGSTRLKEQRIGQGVPQNLWWPRSPGETQRTGGWPWHVMGTLGWSSSHALGLVWIALKTEPRHIQEISNLWQSVAEFTEHD